jgi:MFS family permease
VPETILPFDLLREPTVSAGAACMCLAGMCMFGTIAFVPLFVQGVIGTSATSSGVVLTPLMLGAVVASILSGQWVSRTGRYRANALLGPIVLGAGMTLLWRMDVGTTSAQAARNMVVTGVGMGLMMQVFVLAAQNAVPTRVIGVTTSLLQFGRAIGTTFGVTLFGVIVNQGLPREVRGEAVVHRLSPQARAELASALHPAFLAAMAVCVVIWVVAFLGIRERPLRTSFDEEAPVAAQATAEGRGAGSEIRSR